MSDNYIKIIPNDPDYIPGANSKNKTVLLLGSIFDQAEDINSEIFETITFIHPGANFESVSCPACSSEITAWWSNKMSELYEEHFSNLITTTPCCQSTISINDLDYHFQAGFARFVIEIKNPSIAREMDDEVIHQVESSLGCKVRQIFVHL